VYFSVCTGVVLTPVSMFCGGIDTLIAPDATAEMLDTATVGVPVTMAVVSKFTPVTISTSGVYAPPVYFGSEGVTLVVERFKPVAIAVVVASRTAT
jgi:hypothetical protein